MMAHQWRFLSSSTWILLAYKVTRQFDFHLPKKSEKNVIAASPWEYKVLYTIIWTIQSQSLIWTKRHKQVITIVLFIPFWIFGRITRYLAANKRRGLEAPQHYSGSCFMFQIDKHMTTGGEERERGKHISKYSRYTLS